MSSDPQSPELRDRLAALAAPGTPSDQLRRTLQDQGFDPPVACSTAPRVFQSSFRQRRGGGLTYATDATISWEVDAAGRVVWTHGRIVYDGL